MSGTLVHNIILNKTPVHTIEVTLIIEFSWNLVGTFGLRMSRLSSKMVVVGRKSWPPRGEAVFLISLL